MVRKTYNSVYFWMLPQTTILYFVAFRLRTKWTSTFILGLMANVGTPIVYYFDWVIQQNLISPVLAFLYIPLFFASGIAADISLMKLHPGTRRIRVSVVSSLIFATTVLVTTGIAALLFYPNPSSPLSADGRGAIHLIINVAWIKMGMDFLIPYSIITGALGGYLGYSIARDTHMSDYHQ